MKPSSMYHCLNSRNTNGDTYYCQGGGQGQSPLKNEDYTTPRHHTMAMNHFDVEPNGARTLMINLHIDKKKLFTIELKTMK